MAFFHSISHVKNEKWRQDGGVAFLDRKNHINRKLGMIVGIISFWFIIGFLI